jgi:ParB family transcriptional regulator, chromosome partitioning protein
MAPATEAETEAEAEERKRNYEQQRKEYEQQQERRAEESRLEDERREKEWEAERARREKLQKARTAKFDCILENAPAMFSAAQLRVFLRALVNLDPYTFADDVAEHFAAEDENNDKSAEEILLATVDGLTDDKLTGFALRLVLTGNIPIPREGEVDSLTEAETAFVPAKPKRTAAKTAKSTHAD